MTLAESPPGSCVCVKPIGETASVAVGGSRKPHDSGVCAASHTAAVAVSRWLSAVVVVVVVSKMGSNYYAKRSQIPVWDLTPGWFDE